MKAHELRKIDKEYDMHLQAWLNVQAQSTKEQGKKQVPVYKTFKEFFDYEARIREVLKPKKKRLDANMRRMARIAKMANAGEEVTDGRKL